MLFWLLFIVFAIVCVALVGLVLMQEPKQGGLSSSVGGDARDFISGRGTQGGLIRVTIYLGAAFLVLAIILGLIQR
jgi:preprotein translocase subunit SecG